MASVDKTFFSATGKTAIVTGAGSGINLAFAELLLSRGCNVVIADLSLRPEAKEVVAKYQAETDSSPRALFVETDVTSWRALENVFDATLKAFGSFDIVCPGAGVYEPNWSNFWHPPGAPESRDAPDADRYALYDINLTHPTRTTQLAISHWLHPRPNPTTGETPAPATPAAPKRIVHISSVAGQLGVFRAPLYGASKFAITGLVRCLAKLEPESGIRVNAVAPGIVRTPLWTENPEKAVNIDEEHDGWVTPTEVAEAMLRCVEDEAYIGGTVVEVGKDFTRFVSMINDPGPDFTPGKGLITSKAAKGDDMVRGWLGDGAIWGGRA